MGGNSPKLAIVLLIIGVGLFLYFYYFRNTVIVNTTSDNYIELVDDDQTLKFKQAFQNMPVIFSPEDYKKVDEYKSVESEKLFNPDAKSWDEDDLEIRELIQFGFKLLIKYSQEKSFEKALKVATDIVLRVSRIVFGLLEIHVTHEVKHKKVKDRRKRDDSEQYDEVDIFTISKVQKEADIKPVRPKINRYTFSVYIPKLLAMYEYIGNNNCIKKYVCHPIITKMVHALNKSLDKSESGSNMIQYAFPRLLSNYLFDRETYTTERNSPLFQDICSFYNITYNSSGDGPKNGVYEDGSALYHNTVPRYANLFLLEGFYESIFACFGIDYNFHDIIRRIVNKLFHPEIHYVTFGLYSDGGERTKNMKGQLGIAIMPYMGLGLFKSPHFMFSLRVQRPGISAFFKPSKDTPEQFALGWIQLRKMYLPNTSYPNNLTWDLLRKEPGIILFEDQSTYASFDLGVGQTSIYAKEINSFIGRVPDEDVMFWMNKYQLTEYYGDIVITELGVATHNGVEIFYCINKYPPDNKTLQIRVKDPDNFTLYNEPVSRNGLKPLSREGITLRMVIKQNNTVKVRQNHSTGNMEFDFNSKTYSIEVLKPNENYIVHVSHNGQSVYKFGGSSKSESSDTMTHPSIGKNKILVRSPVTYMYE